MAARIRTALAALAVAPLLAACGGSEPAGPADRAAPAPAEQSPIAPAEQSESGATSPTAPEETQEAFLWSASQGEKRITCEDRNGHFTARFTLPPSDSDPLVRELNTLLAQLDEAGWNTIVVSVDVHSTWPEIDEGDYFEQIRLETTAGSITLDYVDDGPGGVLRETGVLSSASDHPQSLRQKAQDLRLRLHERGTESPEVHYLMTKEDVNQVESATARFPGAGKPCTG